MRRQRQEISKVDELPDLRYESADPAARLQLSEERMGVLSFIAMMDKGGRRLKTDRRRESVPLSFPDRRSGRERRVGPDRRGMQTDKDKRDKDRRRALISSPSEL